MKKIIALFCFLMICSSSFAQSNITLELKDAPVRTTLEMMFKQAGIKNYVIENSVAGFVTMNLTDQPFENSLKLVMRAATVPLTYIKENDVWIVKQRVSVPPVNTTPDITPEPAKNNSFEVIHLNHIDPYDLMSVLGNILFVNQFNRQRGGMNGGFSNMGMGNNNRNFGNNSNNLGNQNGSRRP
jgi:hypothetical protein